ncbi:alpha/beta hydrolase [Zhongshania sp. BJYM1]|uniref:alpha/beta hydrolase n=1 Tax=Zhongshania aquatica TaxID=2965069 RepID=UPI0022B47F47|nr:alpha/beta hydrolase-fold protein [Marortus sp. BJYM1]
MNRDLYEELGLHRQFGEDQNVSFLLATVNNRSTSEIQFATQVPGDERYKPCVEAFPGEHVPKGQVKWLRDWRDSHIFPETTRDIAIYIPPGLKAGQCVSLLVCFDGLQYIEEGGAVRATQVLDSLIASGQLPPTLGIFVNPGLPEPWRAADLTTLEFDDAKREAADQRSLEYDSLDNATTRFVVDELMPMAADIADVTLERDPARNIICGMSSGGIAAFTVAWRRPDIFGAVMSHCGSFVNLRGGHNYPYLVRTVERKPIRVYLQSGEADADITFGSWPIANKDMAAALRFAGYEYKFEYGTGGHTLKHGGALFADALRWLSRNVDI